MGKPIANYRSGEYNKKMIPLSVVMDERICTGHEYALFWASVRRYLKHPRAAGGEADGGKRRSRGGMRLISSHKPQSAGSALCGVFYFYM